MRFNRAWAFSEGQFAPLLSPISRKQYEPEQNSRTSFGTGTRNLSSEIEKHVVNAVLTPAADFELLWARDLFALSRVHLCAFHRGLP
jgi:hypothetical protein